MNWIQFLEDHHIDYVTHGPNTKKGEVSVQCPWCGDEDPSHHLGIALEREAWGCHRNRAHRGLRPHRLIQHLINCSHNQAKMVVAQYGQADPDSFEALEPLADTPKIRPSTLPEKLVMPPEFKRIAADGLTAKFFTYLKRRGFHDPLDLAKVYGLRCCMVGKWKDRVIVPIYREKRLIAWTGRAIAKPVDAPRYLSTEGNVIKTTIFNEDYIAEGGKLLLVGEGPIDALKMDYYGFDFEAKATCVFGTSMTMDQISILRRVGKLFKHKVILMDPEATDVALDLSEWLPDFVIGQLPPGVEDPGAMLMGEVHTLICRYLQAS